MWVRPEWNAGKNGVVGVVLTQEGAVPKGTMFNKIYLALFCFKSVRELFEQISCSDTL